MGRMGSLLVGGLLGAGLALLLAPGAGTETQEGLRRRARDLQDRYGDVLEQGRIRATELVKTGREVLDEQMPRVNELVNNAVERARPLVDQRQQGGQAPPKGQTEPTARPDQANTNEGTGT